MYKLIFVACSNKAVCTYRDDYLGDKNTYDEIISKINDHYQNQEIEFKK